MKWQNVGSAPCYKPYRLAYRLSNDQGYEKVFVGDGDREQVAPRRIELFTEEFFKEPKDLPPGEIVDVPIPSPYRTICRREPTPCPSPLLAPKTPSPCAIGNQGAIRGWMVSAEYREYFPIRERASTSGPGSFSTWPPAFGSATVLVTSFRFFVSLSASPTNG